MYEAAGIIEMALSERRSLERALADLIAKHRLYKSPELARMIEQLAAEIAQRDPGTRTSAHTANGHTAATPAPVQNP